MAYIRHPLASVTEPVRSIRVSPPRTVLLVQYTQDLPPATNAGLFSVAAIRGVGAELGDCAARIAAARATAAAFEERPRSTGLLI